MADPISAAISAIVSASVTAAATVLTAGFTQSVFVTLAQWAGNAALFAATSYILTPQVGVGGSPTDWQADPDAGIPFVVGRRGVAGVIVHRDEWGPDNRYQSIVTVYSGAGPVHAFGGFTADDTAVTFSASFGRVTSGTWQDVMWMDRRLGAQPDTALETPADKGDSTVAGTMPGWGSSYKLSGKASSMWTLALDHDRKRYESGEPRPLQTIEGILGWDPRLDSTWPGGSGSCRLDDRSTWVYSTNPLIGALNCALGYWENGVLVGGIGASLAGIDVNALVAAANIADANGWTVSAAFTTKDDKHQVFLGFLQAGGATYANKAGQISCVSRGAPKASIVTITAADTAGSIEIDTAASRLARINTIIPKCVLETHQWDLTPCEPVVVSEYVTEDNGARERGIDYPFVSDAVQAGQLAAYDIVDSREGITGRMTLKPHLRELVGGDAFTITEPGFVLDGQKCLVVDRSFDPSTSTVTITFRSETDAKHAFALGLDPTPPSAPSLTPADPFNFASPDVDDWSATASTLEGANGESRPSVRLTGIVTNAQVAFVEVQYRYRISDGSDGWLDWSDWSVLGSYEPTTSSIEFDTFPPGAQVETRITYISIFGIRSAVPLDLAAVTVGGSIIVTNSLAVGGLTRADLDATLAFLASADPALAGGLGILEQAGARNLYTDPLFLLGVGESISNTAVPSIIEGDPRQLQVGGEVDLGQTLDLVLLPRFVLRPGSRLQAGTEIAISGPLSAATLTARFFDIDLAEIAESAVTIAAGADGERAAGFLEAVDIAAGTYWCQLEVSAVATDWGPATLSISEPFAAYAAPQQSAVELFRDPQDETVAQRLERVIVDQARAFELDGLTYETALSRATILVLQEVTANAARYQISTSYEGADGVDYALVELYAADGVSRILQLAGLLAFGNTTPGGDPIIAMEVRNAVVHILKELRLDDDAAFTYYTPDTVDPGVEPDILRICIGKHPTTAKVGVFLYDEVGGPLLAFNATDNTAVLYPSMAADGFVGASTEGGGTNHDLTTALSARVPADFIALGFYPDGSLPFSAGAQITLELDYQLSAEFNAFEWFGFREVVQIVARNGTDPFAPIHSFDADLKWFSATSNTGQVPPFLGASTLVTKSFTRRETFIMPATPTYDDVRAYVLIAAHDLGGGGDCIEGSLNDTKITDTLKISRYRVRMSQPRPGLTEII